ncbi:MAG: trypsin-like peptidase domain-containing protein [Steroidobacteraceae bacterium]|nr:trypsin-like peptidase domain-containing protein [Steroidobacteraceae bacterium]
MTRSATGWASGRRAAAPALLAALLAAPAAPAQEQEESSRWTRTLERIASGVVAIQIDATRAFDTDWNTSSQATGFVVDAKRGLILTNRHVVTPGPVTAMATFINREEVELVPVYRDPVHDFGFYRYDPSKLRFIQPVELPLYPQGAQIGVEIRVVGNDAGEQLSILAGTLARLDRQAPEYGAGKYNDFNTFYYQAASSTSGGSSGSPVIDIQGRVLALNAGGSTGAASSFYLPLPRVVRALSLVQAGRPVARGTLQTVFRYTPYDELRRLGLPGATEAEARRAAPARTGMLVVTEVQPGAAAFGQLAVGDIVVGVDGRMVVDFDSLGAILDDGVGGSVELAVVRGGERLAFTLPVQDLHDITPDEYLEIGDGVIHTLSWQMARHINVPVAGVYVANPGYMFGSAGIPRGAVLTELAGRPLATLADARAVFETLGHRQRVTLRYFTMEASRTPQLTTLRVDRAWFPARHCVRDDASGLWPCAPIAAGPDAAPPGPRTTQFARSGDRLADAIAPSLVLVEFTMPYSVSGVTERNYHGTGAVLDAARGLVLVDRNTVPVAIGDVRLTFAGTIEVDGAVEYVHPLHNLAVIRYDPLQLGATPVRAIRLAGRAPATGESVHVVGISRDNRVVSQQATVASLGPVAFPLSRTLQFRDANLEVVTLVNGPQEYDGLIVDRRGEVLAHWASFAYENGRQLEQQNMGIPAGVLQETLEYARDGRTLYSAEAEYGLLSLTEGRRLGLDEAWIDRLTAHNPQRRQVLTIERLVAGSPAARLLAPGDLVLAVDGRIVNTFAEVGAAVRAPQVTMTLWRSGSELTVPLPTVALSGRDIDRVLVWAGATLQAPHRAMAAQRAIQPDGVFIAFFMYGSPASRHKLWAGRRITEVDGVPVPDLDAFIQAVAGRPDRSSLRLRTVSWNDAVEVITLKLDRHYWPAYELRRTGPEWRRIPLE